MISLIIPCYNEEENLDKLLNKLDFLKEFDDEKIEIIIVNNGSNDNSHEILKNELYLKNKISILNIQKNKGYGDGIHQGTILQKVMYYVGFMPTYSSIL